MNLLVKARTFTTENSRAFALVPQTAKPYSIIFHSLSLLRL